MSHILRTAEKKSTRSAINTLVRRELRFSGYPSRRSRITTAPAGEIEQERITENSRLLVSVSVGQAPQKPSLATAPSCKLCIEGHQYLKHGDCAFSNNLPNFDTKVPQKRSKLPQNHKTVPNLANKVDFPTFWQKLIILGVTTWVKSAHGSRYKIQPLFGGDWLKNRLKRCFFTKTTTSGPKPAAIILRGICTTRKKKVRDLPSTHLSRELRFGGYPPRRSRMYGPCGGD